MTEDAGRYTHDAEEDFLRDAEQAAPDGHDQQHHTAEPMDGEVHGS